VEPLDRIITVAETISARAPLRVLLVDAPDSVRRALRSVLPSRALCLVEVFDGRTALEVVFGCGIDIAVADVGMEGLDGLSFVRRVRAASERESDVLPVGLLANHLYEDLVRDAADGPTFFARKPVADDSARELVERLVTSIAARRRSPRYDEQSPSSSETPTWRPRAGER
jgi:CheY-like chemotaxis protein